MYIEHIQENADPDTTILDESGLELFLNGDDFPVTGGHDKTSTLRDHPGWITKEPRDKERQELRHRVASGCSEKMLKPTVQQGRNE
jgi:hypothetical protein